MLKFILPSQLRLGMYVQSLSGAWRAPASLRKPFLLEKEDDLLTLQDSPLRAVLIDTSRGSDTESDPAARRRGGDPGDRELDAPDKHPSAVRSTRKVDLRREREQAARIISRAEETVVNMFSEARMGRTIDLLEAGDLVSEITASVSRNADALVSLVRLKTADNYTYMHSVAVCAMMISLSNQLGLPAAEREQAGMAGLLHDIGKMAVPLDILNKPGRLTDEEFATVRSHPVTGYGLLKELPGIGSATLDVSLHHHERMDGAGYPYQLAGERISIFARMGAVCDVYDAITSNRPYKSGWDPARSLQHMAQSKGHFDFDVLQGFVRAVGIYPIGSCVTMQSGHLAIVLDQQPGHLLNPLVRIFYSIRDNREVGPALLDLRHSTDRILGHADPEKLGLMDDVLAQQDLSY
ncbi:HD-GYP domain-containing protein [Herbaspirillum sp. AP02]|uniref:HD-GYP domain-containing protein n=1 Tax=unclassified Herbaspirillum TaxID=2624150 RepID=UPI0015D97DAD|nr:MULTISPECIES: HD-GYP domain-containing protein [unclassified Herbaspirillum]MBG7621612.1 HD-GYP domain-containing protein [Herbaspirillum sp. AP02]NZD69699.1 HD-GYP domain-containing protein [Herbaspirillum sp. AP21]